MQIIACHAHHRKRNTLILLVFLAFLVIFFAGILYLKNLQTSESGIPAIAPETNPNSLNLNKLISLTTAPNTFDGEKPGLIDSTSASLRDLYDQVNSEMIDKSTAPAPNPN